MYDIDNTIKNPMINKTKVYEKRKKRKFTIGSIIVNILLIIFTIVFAFPLYWIFTGSFKIQLVATQIPPEWFPKNPTLQNWIDLFKAPVWQWTFNSIVISICTMVLVVLTATMAGYALAKKQFPGKNIIFWALIGAMALPKQVTLVPLFTMLVKWNWIDSYKCLILPAVGWPFGVFLMKQFTQTMPSELLEAAKIDGSSEWRTFGEIVIPMVKPGMGALAIFTFMTSWNDYFWQLILLRSTNMFTLPLGVAAMQQEFTTNFGVLMAAGTMASLPMIIIFLSFQKYFTQGITLGAVKG